MLVPPQCYFPTNKKAEVEEDSFLFQLLLVKPHRIYSILSHIPTALHTGPAAGDADFCLFLESSALVTCS